MKFQKAPRAEKSFLRGFGLGLSFCGFLIAVMLFAIWISL